MSKNVVLPKYLVELRQPPNLPFQIGAGMTTPDLGVKRMQEWLSLRGAACTPDGQFGVATASAVTAFRRNNNLGTDGVCDVVTYSTLTSQLARATVVPSIIDKDLGENVCRVARMYLNERAREAGGDNRGPWVRHFARGREEAWCQDFASTCWMDAARNMGLPSLPFALCDDNSVMSGYVPWVANEARAAGRFQAGSDPKPIPPGSMFFVRSYGGNPPYLHVGIVIKDNGDGSFETIEGNTNTDGSANGWEVAARHRIKTNCDFGLIK